MRERVVKALRNFSAGSGMSRRDESLRHAFTPGRSRSEHAGPMPPVPRDGSAAPRTGTLSIDGASAEWKPFLFTTNDVPHRQCATELRALLLQQCGAAVANTVHKTARGVMDPLLESAPEMRLALLAIAILPLSGAAGTKFPYEQVCSPSLGTFAPTQFFVLALTASALVRRR